MKKRRENLQDGITKMNSIAIIPARSGSKSLPDKNIKELNGHPLLAYSILTAKASGMFSDIFVSTDSQRYANISVEYGADVSFLRSPKNASDSAGSWDVVREVIEIFQKKGKVFEYIMLLQPTSPLRTKKDIVDSFQLMEEKRASSVISVSEVDHSPLWCNVLPESLSMDNFRNEKYSGLPRQLLPQYYRINGAVYLLKTEELYRKNMFSKGCYAYIMPKERSVDIDTELDFLYAELLMKKYGDWKEKA